MSVLWLIGMPGSGKTTVGKLVAGALDVPFRDSDDLIEERAGADIPAIFSREGEEGFRSHERVVIGELAGLRDVVVATGGGAVLDEENVAVMREAGRIVLLEAGVGELAARLDGTSSRPLLAGDLRVRLAATLAERRSRYREVADAIIDTTGKTPEEIAAEVAS